MSTERKCRVCGCTELNPCVDRAGNRCAWVADDLCSACLCKSVFGDDLPPVMLDCSAGLAEALGEIESRIGETFDDAQALALFFFVRGFQRGLLHSEEVDAAVDQMLALPERPGLILPGEFQQ
jgi:hypothetical protein